jgi:hypothetical protein
MTMTGKVKLEPRSRVHRRAAPEENWREWISEASPAAEKPAETGLPARPVSQPSHQAIALLAYDIWERRGSPLGSPEEDWFEAEKQLLR